MNSYREFAEPKPAETGYDRINTLQSNNCEMSTAVVMARTRAG